MTAPKLKILRGSFFDAASWGFGFGSGLGYGYGDGDGFGYVVDDGSGCGNEKNNGMEIIDCGVEDTKR